MGGTAGGWGSATWGPIQTKAELAALRVRCCNAPHPTPDTSCSQSQARGLQQAPGAGAVAISAIGLLGDPGQVPSLLSASVSPPTLCELLEAGTHSVRNTRHRGEGPCQAKNPGVRENETHWGKLDPGVSSSRGSEEGGDSPVSPRSLARPGASCCPRAQTSGLGAKGGGTR